MLCSINELKTDEETSLTNVTLLSIFAKISVVPFIYKFHFSNGDFGDYWRYTPHALYLLHREAGLFLNLIEVGPFSGYEKYIVTLGSRSSKYMDLELDEKKFLDWNNNIGDNSLANLTGSLIHKVIDTIKLRINLIRTKLVHH